MREKAKEIEVKVKVDNITNLKKELKKLGTVFSLPKKQTDSYFRLRDLVNQTQTPGSYILRIRRGSKSYLTLKAFTSRYGVWEEYETEVENPHELEIILKRIGFVKILTVHKKRTSAKLNKFNLEIDEVRELGTYLEAEVLGYNGKKIQEEIKNFFLKLGLPKENIERRGYPEILLERQGFKFEGQR